MQDQQHHQNLTAFLLTQKTNHSGECWHRGHCFVNLLIRLSKLSFHLHADVGDADPWDFMSCHGFCSLFFNSYCMDSET